MTRLSLALAVCAWFASATNAADASVPVEGRPVRVFALLVGVNHTAEANLQPLRYADDDAVRYRQLFETLGARTYLLAQIDDNTRRLHPDSVTAAIEPTRAGFDRAVTELAREVNAARARGERAVFYLLYAGHGDRDERTGKGFLTLADARLSATALQRSILERIDASEYHLIVDACNSGFLAVERGPGGERRQLTGFVTEVATGARDPRVGLLFATSSMRKTFEYEGYQAGVFSHLVRSGLHGGADFNLDGQVSYDEIQRFVSHATAPVPNEKYRPQVHALRPLVTGRILDMRPGLARGSLVVDGAVASAHHVVEDANGVRLLDFHNGEGQRLRLVRPVGAAPITVFRADGAHGEYELPDDHAVIELGVLEPRARVIAARGAADNAFQRLFSLAFEPQALSRVEVSEQDFLGISRAIEEERLAAQTATRRRWARTSFLLGGAALATGITTTVMAIDAVSDPGPQASQIEVEDRNQRARALRWTAGVSYGIAGAAAVAGALLYFWPGEPSAPGEARAGVGVSLDGVSVHGKF